MSERSADTQESIDAVRRVAAARGKLQIAVARMIRDYPFHARLLELHRLEADPRVSTMGVTVRGVDVVFLFDPEFVLEECSIPQLQAVLHHEVNHCLLGHLTMDRKQYTDRWAWLCATEVTANEFVPESLPGTPIVLADFPGLAPGEDTDSRYRRLARGEGDGARRELGPDPETTDNHAVWASCTREPELAELAIEVAVREAASRLSDAEMQRLPTRIRDEIARRTGQRVERWSTDSRVGRVVDWRKALRVYLKHALEAQPTYGRPARRFPHLVGIVPGRARRPTRARVMAVIDTSGSVTREMLSAISDELNRLACVHDVVVVECDDAVRAIYPHRSWMSEVRGRGATDLRPPFATDVLRRVRPDAIVYATDGHGIAPLQAPPIPVVWCLTAAGRRPASWGRVIRLPECNRAL